MNESGPRAGIDRGRILVGVDGSEDGLRAVTYASTEALVTGGDVWIVHAIDDAAPITGLWDIVSSPEVRRHAADNIVAEATAGHHQIEAVDGIHGAGPRRRGDLSERVADRRDHRQ